MRPILTPFLALYWTVAFAVLAVVAISGGEAGATRAIRMAGIAAADLPAGTLAATVLAFVLALIAALFLWAFVQGVLDDRIGAEDSEAVLRLCFGAAFGMATLLCVAAAVGGAEQGFSAPTALLGALAASYVAIAAERWISRALAATADMPEDGGARLKAMDAARQALTPRALGRETPQGLGDSL